MQRMSQTPVSAQELGARVRMRRVSLGVSQRELAQNAGIVHSHLSRIESGRTAVSVSVLTRLAFALDVPARVFIEADGADEIATEDGRAPLRWNEQEVLQLYRSASQSDRAQIERLMLLMVSSTAGTAPSTDGGQATLGWRALKPSEPAAVRPDSIGKHYRIFSVGDEAMAEANIRAGDLIAGMHGQAEEGDIVVVEVAGVGLVLRYYYPQPDGSLELRSSASDKQPMVVQRRSVHRVWIATHVRRPQ